MTGAHQYCSYVVWRGNTGNGTRDYQSYSRDYEIVIDGKMPIEGSADALFLGDTHRLNPEDLLVSAISACHMLAYLALCAKEGVQVEEYDDHATAVMELTATGAGSFLEASLFPSIRIAKGSNLEKATLLHDAAHKQCFVAQSVRFPVTVEPTITVAAR